MNHLGVALAFVGLAFVSSPMPSSALPSISVVRTSSSTGRLDVITSDPGVLGAEISIVLVGMKFTGVTINSAIFGAEKPGDNPFLPGSPEGGDTTGLWLRDDQQSLFASYQSQQVGPGTYPLLQFEYETLSTSTCVGPSATADGFVSVNGVTTNVPASFTVPLDGGCSNPRGDTDRDGDIDLTDLGNVKNGFGSTNPLALGDTNGDSLIDIVDLNNVKNNFGAAIRAVAIPEPASLVIVTGMMLSVVAARHSSNR
jgi:hypothetical protein